MVVRVVVPLLLHPQQADQVVDRVVIRQTEHSQAKVLALADKGTMAVKGGVMVLFQITAQAEAAAGLVLLVGMPQRSPEEQAGLASRHPSLARPWAGLVAVEVALVQAGWLALLLMVAVLGRTNPRRQQARPILAAAVALR